MFTTKMSRTLLTTVLGVTLSAKLASAAAELPQLVLGRKMTYEEFGALQFSLENVAQKVSCFNNLKTKSKSIDCSRHNFTLNGVDENGVATTKKIQTRLFDTFESARLTDFSMAEAVDAINKNTQQRMRIKKTQLSTGGPKYKDHKGVPQHVNEMTEVTEHKMLSEKQKISLRIAVEEQNNYNDLTSLLDRGIVTVKEVTDFIARQKNSSSFPNFKTFTATSTFGMGGKASLEKRCEDFKKYLRCSTFFMVDHKIQDIDDMFLPKTAYDLKRSAGMKATHLGMKGLDFAATETLADAAGYVYSKYNRD